MEPRHAQASAQRPSRGEAMVAALHHLASNFTVPPLTKKDLLGGAIKIVAYCVPGNLPQNKPLTDDARETAEKVTACDFIELFTAGMADAGFIDPTSTPTEEVLCQGMDSYSAWTREANDLEKTAEGLGRDSLEFARAWALRKLFDFIFKECNPYDLTGAGLILSKAVGRAGGSEEKVGQIAPEIASIASLNWVEKCDAKLAFVGGDGKLRLNEDKLKDYAEQAIRKSKVRFARTDIPAVETRETPEEQAWKLERARNLQLFRGGLARPSEIAAFDYLMGDFDSAKAAASAKGVTARAVEKVIERWRAKPPQALRKLLRA